MLRRRACAAAGPLLSRDWLIELERRIALGLEGCRFGLEGSRLGLEGSRLEGSRLEGIGITLEGSRNVVIKSQAQLSRFDACLAHVAQATTTTGRGETRTMIS